MSRPYFPLRASLPFILLTLLLAALWLAGGASRGDVAGQVVSRAIATTLLIIAILFGPRPSLAGVRPIAVVLAAAILLAVLQMIPLPPNWWSALPGRQPFLEAAAIAGQPQPWRPVSIVPDATLNAAFALLIPLTVFVLLSQISSRESGRLVGVLLFLAAAASGIGLLQLSGEGPGNPLINDSIGQVSGNFANRNHFALFLAIGCVLAPTWAFQGERRFGWRIPIALGLIILFVMTILGSGSRAGMLAGGAGVIIGLVMARHGIRGILGDGPRWLLPAVLIGIVAIVALFILLSVAADRAVSLDRVLATDAGQDMRRRGLPTVIEMIRTYFPMGSGFGGFDPLFRMHEPFELLKLSYFNHAHNDFLEVVLDGGLPGLVLLVGALGWWAQSTFQVWRSADAKLGRLASAIIGLVLLASLFDYPARTPMMMAVVVIAATWLSQAASTESRSALPGQSLSL